MAYTLTVAGLVFDRTQPDWQGDTFWIENIEGIESPEIDYQREDTLDLGGVTTHHHVSRREINITGWMRGKPREEDSYWRAREKCMNAFQTLLFAPGWVYFDDPYQPWQAKCRMTGRFNAEAPVGNQVGRFDVTLTAEDPRRYARNLSVVNGDTTTVIAKNEGNATTYLSATVNVQAANLWIRNDSIASQPAVNVLGTLPVGTFINFQEQTIWKPGTGYVQPNAPLYDFFFPLLPGDNAIELYGNWKLEWRSAWL